MHADQVKQEVAPQVPVCDVRTTVLHKQHDGLVHLVICYKPGQKVIHLVSQTAIYNFFFFWCIFQNESLRLTHAS